ncbi:hypothetical protein I302_108560 [Kwoniella bestiolae CBS 10118]|uniref:Uncharacterized protein n=1 Tax=Kwoniella bestiolae CBS 10118 TaxID=1296100 RepID=A0A1B9FVC5_9TREE|nr:hypothetical protein I302_07067 [Kwoniella bestiolae CBS 10118]OCF22727.1 hypothetical protein I302_07067 [Kwoniella bestiolae CBS 10118]
MLFLALLSLLPVLASAVNITTYADVPLAPEQLPPSAATKNGDAIVSAFANLSRNTKWNLVQNITLEGDIGEPEGMVRIGDDRIVVAWGDWVVPTKSYGKDEQGNSIVKEGTDRENGQGYAHLSIFDGMGKRIADTTLNNLGDAEYHIGGVDYDGEYIWTELSEYRPNSTATIIRVNPYTYEHEPIVHIDDHSGGVLHDTEKNTITALNWGSRNATKFSLDSQDLWRRPESKIPNPSLFADYQDCKWLGYPSQFDNEKSTALCAGVAAYSIKNTTIALGGLAIVDIDTMIPLMEVPITLYTPKGTSMTQNPVDVDVVDGKMRLYFAPDQHNGTIFVHETL